MRRFRVFGLATAVVLLTGGAVAGGASANPTNPVGRSGSVRPATAVFSSVPTPRILGVARIGSVLKVSMAATKPVSTLHFQWRANNVAIPGATGVKYTVRPANVDRRITVVVTAARAGYKSVTRSSAATAVVPGQKYANCTALKRSYPYGVAKVGVRYNRTASGNRPLVGPPFFSNSVYSLNSFSDLDKDGIACEHS